MIHTITEDPFALLQPYLRGDIDVPGPVARLYLASQMGDQSLIDAASMDLSGFKVEADSSSGVDGYEVYRLCFQWSNMDHPTRRRFFDLEPRNKRCPEIQRMIQAERVKRWKSYDAVENKEGVA